MWPDDEGSWDLGDAYAQPRTSDTVTPDLATASQRVDNSGTGSGWPGFLQKSLGSVLSYAVQKDAAQSNLALAQQRAATLSTQPLVSTTGGTVGVNTTGLLLVAGLVLAVVMAANNKG